MQQGNKFIPPVNIYGIFDNELTRMHELVARTAEYEARAITQHAMQQAHSSYTNTYTPHSSVSTVYKRLRELQDVLIAAMTGRDEIIQQKVAELALTGDDTPPDTI